MSEEPTGFNFFGDDESNKETTQSINPPDEKKQEKIVQKEEKIEEEEYDSEEEEGEYESEGEEEEGEYDSEEEGEEEVENEIDDFLPPTEEKTFVPKKKRVQKQEITAPPSNLGFDTELEDEQEEEETLTSNFGFSHNKGVPMIPKENEQRTRGDLPPINHQEEIPSEPSFLIPPPTEEVQAKPQNITPRKERGMPISAHSTQDIKSLPRPKYKEFNQTVRQPDCSPMFFSFKEKKADMTKVQSSSEFIRSTTQYAANSPSLLKKYGLPFGVTLHPFAKKIPVVSLGFNEVIRCYNCRSYVNPFCRFIERGYKWKCNICQSVNDVPKCYYSQLDENGCREDIHRRKELRYGSVEYIAPRRYNTKLTNQPVSIVYLIDVSYNAITNGSVKVVCDAIIESLKHLPSGGRTRVSIITYDHSLHFYDLDPRNEKPRVFCVGELNDSLIPIPKHLLVNLLDSRELIEKTLRLIPTKLWGKNESVQSAYFSALASASRLVNRSGGKIISFLANLPSVGKTPLKNREGLTKKGIDGTDLFNPADQTYKDVALGLNRDTVSVDLFCTSSQPLDLSSLASIPFFTSGNVRYFPHFTPEDHHVLRTNVIKASAGIFGFDGVVRIRVSGGMKIKSFIGSFFTKGFDLLSLPYVDNSKGLAFELVHSGSYLKLKNISIQAAVLFTNHNGERRIRVHNLMIPVTANLYDLYKSTDIHASMDLLSKLAVDDIKRNGLLAQRNYIFNTISKCIKTYRTEVRDSSQVPYNQLYLSDNISFLPLYALGLLKSYAFVENEAVAVDHRNYAINRILTGTTKKLALKYYPSFFNVVKSFSKKAKGKKGDIVVLPLSQKALTTSSIALLNNGEKMYLFIGSSYLKNNTELVNELLKLINYLNLKPNIPSNTKMGKHVVTQNLFELIRLERERYGIIPIVSVSSKSKMEKRSDFFFNLKEDLFMDTKYNCGYNRFLVLLHKHVVQEINKK